jgi:rare lipoprotein A
MVMSNLNICTNLLLKRMTHCLLALLAMLMLNGCSSTGDGSGNSGRYAMQNDAPPDGDVNLDPNNIPDAVPVLEPRSSAGNKSPYTVLGETYEVMPESSGYTDTGKASWYGKKFHGYKTSNGEIFDMYKMSAAHRTLPIPSYVRVTNLANGRSGIVRVNDRGPFHSERIMDLSYAAAVKLDMLRSGTAQVRIEVINPSTQAYAVREADKDRLSSGSTSKPSARTTYPSAENTAEPQKTPVHGGSTYLQAGAFRNQDSAMALRDKLVNLTGKPVNIDSLDGLFKVRIGPLADPNEVHNISELMLQNNFAKPQVVYF